MFADSAFPDSNPKSCRRRLAAVAMAMASLGALVALSACGGPSASVTTAHYYKERPALLYGKRAVAPPEAPPQVHRAVAAANSVQAVPYQYGGGHGRPSWGLDCSGTVSYILRSSGLMNGAASSGELSRFGSSGPGRWISIYAKDGHAFMTIAGLRLDTTTHGKSETGPRWTLEPRNVRGFKVRHPPGL
jgi:hypothetical protein